MLPADRARMGLAEVLSTADGVTGYFVKRVSWARDNRDDLLQEVRMAILKARASFDVRVSANEEAYLWRAGHFAAQRYIWAQRFPVSGGSHRPAQSRGGLRTIHLDAPLPGTDSSENAVTQGEGNALQIMTARGDGGPGDTLGAAEGKHIRREWRHMVRRRLGELAAPGVVAAVLDIEPDPTPDDTRLAKYLKKRILGDEELYRLSKEAP